MNFGGTLRLNKLSCFTFIFVLFLIIHWRSDGQSSREIKIKLGLDDFINLKTLLKVSIYVAERGGKKVYEGSKGMTQEGVNTFGTSTDYASHCAMYYTLKNTFPKLNVVSEEHSEGDGETNCIGEQPLDAYSIPEHSMNIELLFDEHAMTKDVTVWIDPLDASKAYTEQLYHYVTTMVCVAIKGVPVIGVIHYPFLPKTYWGWLTRSTSENIPSVATSHRKDNKEHPTVVVSRSHAGKVREKAIEAFGPKTNVQSAAGAGYKVMAVVNGTYDVYLHATAVKKWDICAGDAILRTLYGKMSTIKGEHIDYSPDSSFKVIDGILASRFNHDYYLNKVSKIVHKLPLGVR